MSDKKDINTMDVVRAAFKESGLTLHELGLKMGFDAPTARQAVFQFMKTDDPRISSLKRFSRAMGISMRRLID